MFDAITIFKNNEEKWGVLKETGGKYKILVEPVYESMGFNHVLNYLEAVDYTASTWQVDGNNYYFFDVNGRLKAKRTPSIICSHRRERPLIGAEERFYGPAG